jgi:hypothetical protein
MKLTASFDELPISWVPTQKKFRQFERYCKGEMGPGSCVYWKKNPIDDVILGLVPERTDKEKKRTPRFRLDPNHQYSVKQLAFAWYSGPYVANKFPKKIENTCNDRDCINAYHLKGIYDRDPNPDREEFSPEYSSCVGSPYMSGFSSCAPSPSRSESGDAMPDVGSEVEEYSEVEFADVLDYGEISISFFPTLALFFSPKTREIFSRFPNSQKRDALFSLLLTLAQRGLVSF